MCLRDIWPAADEIDRLIATCVHAEMFQHDYADVFAGDQRWRSLPVPDGDIFARQPASTYVRRPPYLDGMPDDPAPVRDIEGARVLALLGDSVTTDHISPAGAIARAAGTRQGPVPVDRHRARRARRRRGNTSSNARSTC